MGSNIDLTIITLKMQHHASNSGYDRLIDFLDARTIHTSNDLSVTKRVLAKCVSPVIRSSGTLWYHRANLLTELEAAKKWLRSSNQVFHFLYGENSYRYLGVVKQRIAPHNKIVCTYHTPQQRFQEVVKQKNHLKKIDAVIVVSTVQKEFFSSLLGADKVFYVPHGVDLEFFQPSNIAKVNDGELRCIFVGQHLRDFETLAQTAKLLEHEKYKIRFVIVTREDKHVHFKGLSNVDFHSSVSDNDLVSLYQSADVLLLPLLDCTANNALLEGMACGLPVVSTDLIGVRDYVNDACALLTPKQNVSALVTALSELCENPELRTQMGKQSRKKAKEFDWVQIALQTKKVYEYASS